MKHGCCAAAMVAMMLFAVAGWAQDGPSLLERPPSDKAEVPAGPARAFLEKAMAGVKASETALTLHQVINVTESGKNEKMTMDMGLWLKADNLFRLEIKDGNNDVRFHFDGATLTMYDTKGNRYREMKAPGVRIATLSMIMRGPSGPTTAWLTRYLHNDPKLWDEFFVFEDKGEEEAAIQEGSPEKLRRLFIGNKMYDLSVWFTTGEVPVLRRMEMDSTKGIRGQENAPQDIQLVGVLDVSPMKDAAFGDDVLKFTPPAGATKQEPKAPQKEGKSDLEGKPAPDISLDLLGGGRFSLAEQKGKNIVIADFWATWCGPCRMSLPLLMKVAEAYKDKPVKFITVNQQETEDKVKAFVEKEKLTLPVAMDKDSKAGDAYGVSSIPFMVIIDKEGNVKRIHNGYSPTLDADLSKELDEMLK